MKILSWNCRGLGNPAAVRALKKLLQSNCPDVMFLMETKLADTDTKAKANLFCDPLSNLFMVNCDLSAKNRSGGLALIWNQSVNINILSFNKISIDAYITSCNTNIQWYATCIYGSPYANHKHLTCETINNLHLNRQNDSWIVFGDFNMILNGSEKLGGNGVDYYITSLFNETLNHCNLNDLGYSVYKYTWANNQIDNHHIQERLDRFCANIHWTNQFPRYSNKHLLRYTSDHAPSSLSFFMQKRVDPLTTIKDLLDLNIYGLKIKSANKSLRKVGGKPLEMAL